MLQDLFVNSTILITFISLGNQYFFRKNTLNNNKDINSNIKLGIFFGILGCFLMIYSVKVNATVIVDLRNIAIIISAIYGGFASSMITCLIIGFFRVLYFGVNFSSVTAFITAIITGIVCSIITYEVSFLKKQWIYSIISSSFVVSIAYFILIKDYSLLLYILFAFWTSSILIGTILGSYLNYLNSTNELFIKYKDDSIKDYLTGLNNVRQFDKIFNDLINKISEKGEKLSLLFIDIDFFKKVNDTYGHVEGDLVLKQLANILISTCRSFDVISRNGGEEFSVLLLDCSSKEANTIAERIRRVVKNHLFEISNGKHIQITASIGIACYRDTTTNIWELIVDADSALYSAKHSGRDKVVLYKKDALENTDNKYV